MTAVEESTKISDFDHDSSELTSKSAAYWLRKERLAAVRDVIACNDQRSPVADAFVEVVRSALGTKAGFLSFLTEDCVMRQKQAYLEVGGLSQGTPGFCFWTLVPEKPQALVIEDAALDARTCHSPLVTHYPYVKSYAAAPLVSSNRERIGTLCVLDTKPRTFKQEHISLVCNIAELIMRLLEGQVMLKRPQSSILCGNFKRGAEAYNQSFAIVYVTGSVWQILASSQAFDEMTGVKGDAKQKDMWSLFKNPAVKQKDMKQDSDASLDGEWQIEGLNPYNKNYTLSAVMLQAKSEFDPRCQLVGIPCLFTKRSLPVPSSDLKMNNLYIVLVSPSKQQDMHKTALAPPIENLHLQAPLGKGAYAKVYRGQRDDVEVAVKVVHKFVEGVEGVDMPESAEATLMQSVEHPNLVKLYDWKLLKTVKEESRLWLIMELCDRGSIAEAIDAGHFRTSPDPTAPLQEHTIAHIFKELLSGLKALHDSGIIHCDISGGNVMLQSVEGGPYNFTAKIGDFGLARRKGGAAPGQLAGSYSYLAQEVLREGSVSKASDAYSLGVLLHEMLCGESAWGGLHASQVYYSVVECKETPKWPQNIPKGLKNIAEKLLQYEPEDRCSLETALQLVEKEL